jgi:hypothetical protein
MFMTFYTRCSWHFTQVVHDTLHKLFMIFYTCSHFIQDVYDIYTKCSWHFKQNVHDILHKMFVTFYTRCSWHFTQDVHDILCMFTFYTRRLRYLYKVFMTFYRRCSWHFIQGVHDILHNMFMTFYTSCSWHSSVPDFKIQLQDFVNCLYGIKNKRKHSSAAMFFSTVHKKLP